MDKEKIKQIISDFDDLREKVIDTWCSQNNTKSDSVKSFIINTEKNGVYGTIYDFDDFSYDYFITWEELND